MMNKKKLAIVLLVLLIILVPITGAFGYYSFQLSPLASESEEVWFTVREGVTTEEILSNLKSEGIIRDVNVAKVYMKLSKNDDIKAGSFVLDRSWNLKQIITYMNDASNVIYNEVMVTIPEGYWAKHIAKEMSEHTNVTEEELLSLWNNKEYINSLKEHYWFITDEMFKSEHSYLEGYLFPETYSFYVDTTAEDITEKFLDQTLVVLDKYKDDISSTGYTIHEIITFASIVQFEGSTEENMNMIAGVFFNRLEDGWRLGSSVTVCYALYEYDSWIDCERNPDIASSYNTYSVYGLPPGPIMNPGEIAIRATVYPTASNYYYFIADVYGDGTVYFAEDYAGHEANIDKYLR